MNDTVAWILGTLCWLTSFAIIIWMFCQVAFATEVIITVKHCDASNTYSDHAVYDNNVDCYYI